MNFREEIKKIGYDFGITQQKDEECLNKIESLLVENLRKANINFYFSERYGEYVWYNFTKLEQDKIMIKSFFG